MSIEPTCYHCRYFRKEQYSDGENYEKYYLYECDLDHPDVDIDQDPCEDFEPSMIAKKLYDRGVLIRRA